MRQVGVCAAQWGPGNGKTEQEGKWDLELKGLVNS